MTASKYFLGRDSDRSLWSSCVPRRGFWTLAETTRHTRHDISHANIQLKKPCHLELAAPFFGCWNVAKKLKIIFLSSAGFKAVKWIEEFNLLPSLGFFIDRVVVKGDWPKEHRRPDWPDVGCCFSFTFCESYGLLELPEIRGGKRTGGKWPTLLEITITLTGSFVDEKLKTFNLIQQGFVLWNWMEMLYC